MATLETLRFFVFLRTQYKILQNKLLKTLRTSYFTTRTIPQSARDHDNSAVINIGHRQHLAELKLNIQLRKIHRTIRIITKARFALHVGLTLGKQVISQNG